MNPTPRRIVTLALFFAGASSASATTWHVSPSGNDANIGSAGLPFRTIQRAADVTVAGDTVVVHPGTYTGFNVSRSGAPGLPVTYLAEPGVLVNTAAAPFRGNQRARINIDIASWIVVDGFEVTGTNDQRTSRAGIRVVTVPEQPQSDVIVRNCHAHHNGEWGIFTGHVA